MTATGDATALSGIMRMVAAAQASGSRAQAIADRAAAILFYVALAAGAVTLVFWWLQGDREGALVRTATVLVIACPHALGLAIPLVIAISTSLGARNGLLVKDRLALERARTLDTVVFDKTGTLTRGEPVLVDAAAAPMPFGWPRPSRPTPNTRWRAPSRPARTTAVWTSRPRRRSRRWPAVAPRPRSTAERSPSAALGSSLTSTSLRWPWPWSGSAVAER